MKVYILYSYYYDNCDEWDHLIDIFDSEEKAIMAQIEEEDQDHYKSDPDHYRTQINCYEVK